MQKSNEDCFYFLTSSCTKGSACTYRHSPLALNCNVICPSWTRGSCLVPDCPHRHTTTTTTPRPMTNNGILCFYENTPTGCLRPTCTFMHARPRMNLRGVPTIRPVSANLIKKDGMKPIVTNTSPIKTPQITPVSNSTIDSSQSITNEVQSTSLGISTDTSTSSPIGKTETITRRFALLSDTEQSIDTKTLPDNNNNSLSSIKSTTRSIITDSPKTNSEDTTTTTSSRLIVNRNVVYNESTNISNRKVVQTTSPSVSNRVVLSANTVNTSSKEKKNELDLIEQENKTKKFKQDSQSIIDISFPCSTPSILNRLGFPPSKEVISTNDTKPIRLKRDQLSSPNTSNGNLYSSDSKSSNEEKTSAGTGLSPDEERRTMRIGRFQKKPISPPRSIISSPSSSAITITNVTSTQSTVTRNVITSVPNERKRTAPETTLKDAPPSKRVSTSSSSQDRPLPRQTMSSPSIRDKKWEKQTNEFIAKTAQQNNSSSTTTTITTIQSRSASPSTIRPQPIVPPPLQQSSGGTPRPRQPPSVVIKRSLAPVTAPTQISTRPIEQASSTTTANNVTSLKPPVEQQTTNTVNEEDENQLLKLNESADVVDTFALIEEALLEADHLLELM